MSVDVARRRAARAAVTMAGVLATFGTAVALHDVGRRAGWSGPGTDRVIAATALAVVLARAPLTRGTRGARGARLAVIVLLAVPAFAVARLWHGSTPGMIAGSALLVAALSAAVWVRRFGPAWSRAGTLATLPFVALFVAPFPPQGQGAAGLGWTLVLTVVAGLWTLLAALAGDRLPTTATAPAPTGPPATPTRPEGAPRRPAATRSAMTRTAASTRMAAQLAVALTAALVAGHVVFGEHWPWAVLTAYVVSSGNRGRGDVAYKGVLRVAGALAGTAAATVVAATASAAAGSAWTVAGIFVVLALGMWGRDLSYAVWAAAMTAALALLYAYLGESGTHLLGERLAAIVVGGALAVAAAWWVLPVRTLDVVRRRTADALAALGEALAAARTPDATATARTVAAYDAATDRLREVAPVLEAHVLALRALRRARPASHPLVPLDALDACRQPLRALVGADPREGAVVVGVLQANVGALRRGLGARTGADLRDLPSSAGADARALDARLRGLADYLAAAAEPAR